MVRILAGKHFYNTFATMSWKCFSNIFVKYHYNMFHQCLVKHKENVVTMSYKQWYHNVVSLKVYFVLNFLYYIFFCISKLSNDKIWVISIVYHMIATMKNVHHVITKKIFHWASYKCIHATFIAYKIYNSVTDQVVILKKLKRAIIKAHDKINNLNQSSLVYTRFSHYRVAPGDRIRRPEQPNWKRG